MSNMYGNLYLVSTPIGNLEDLTFRAVKVLSSVDIILAESVERTKKLLSHYDIDAKVISFNKDNEKRKINNAVACLKASKNIALVSQETFLFDGTILDNISYPNLDAKFEDIKSCLLYTSPSPRDKRQSRMPSSA